MSDITVNETIAYQWSCDLCGECGPLEISRPFAKEAGNEHHCSDEPAADKPTTLMPDLSSSQA